MKLFTLLVSGYEVVSRMSLVVLRYHRPLVPKVLRKYLLLHTSFIPVLSGAAQGR